MLLLFTALAATTPEEDALAALLAGRESDAVRHLSRAETPELDQAAVLLALRVGEFSVARSLLPDPLPAWARWAQVDVLAGEGRAAEAAEAAIAEMDLALGGSHRQALVELLVGWAAERAATDGEGARQLLEAALAMGAEGEVARPAEDALLALPLDDPGDVAWRIAAARVAEGKATPSAERVVGLALREADPARSAVFLGRAADGDTVQGAIVAARAAAGLALPSRDILPVLDSLTTRFPTHQEGLRIRLAYAATLLATEPVVALQRLDSLALDPTLGLEATVLAAEGAPDPQDRYRRWRAIGEVQGRSALGARASVEALQALRDHVDSASDRAAAVAFALAQPGADADPTLLFAAVAQGPDRLEALRGLRSRFPFGPWCGELARLEVEAGATGEIAKEWNASCSPFDPWGEALTALATEEPFLALVPGSFVRILVTGVASVEVASHRVDPEALLAAGELHPLDTPLDSFLVAPDRVDRVGVIEDRVQIVPVADPRLGPLVAITARAGDLRATLLAPVVPLEVVGVRVGDEIALGTRRDGRVVGGVPLVVQDGSGVTRRVTTGRDGLARIGDVEGLARVLAVRGDAVGFASFADAAATPAEGERVSVVVWDAGLPTEGAEGGVTVTAPGGRDRAVQVVSRAADGSEVERTEVQLTGGVASATLWLVGGGSVQVAEGDEVLSAAQVPVPGTTEGAVAIANHGHSVAQLSGSVSFSVTPRVPIPPEGLRVAVVLRKPWGVEEHDLLLRSAEPVFLPVGLEPAVAGDIISLTATVAGHGPIYAAVTVRGDFRSDPEPAPPDVPLRGALLVRHREHIEAVAWRDAGLGPGPGWLRTSDPEDIARFTPEPAPPAFTVTGTLERGRPSMLDFPDLPAGSTVWAWVTDASAFGSAPSSATLPEPWSGSAGDAALAWAPDLVRGELIAAALLAEEERVREALAPERLDYAFSADAEEASMGMLGGKGSGYGMGGLGSSGWGRGGAVGGVTDTIHGGAPGSDPRLLASLLGVPAARWSMIVPAWVSQVWVRVVAKTPDGLWAVATVALPVSGPRVSPYEAPPPASPPASWDGRPASLLPVALALPADARMLALSGLVAEGVPGAAPPLAALRALGVHGPGGVLAGALARAPVDFIVAEEPLPDPRRAERALQALLLAPSAPDRALAAARRLLTEPALDEVTAVTAWLALWAAAAPGAELSTASRPGGSLTLAARALATRPKPDAAPTLASLALHPDADPLFRAVALVGLARTRTTATRTLPEVSAAALDVRLEPALASWQGETFARGTYGVVGPVAYDSPAQPSAVPLHGLLPIRVSLPPLDRWTRLECPEGVAEVGPAATAREVTCHVSAHTLGPVRWSVRWLATSGLVLGAAEVVVTVVPGSPPAAHSPAERYALGLALSRSGHADGVVLLEGLLADPDLGPTAVSEVSRALLQAAVASGDAGRIVAAFGRYREMVASGDLDLVTAAAVARAMSSAGAYPRAIAAVRVVADARFREELGAVEVIRGAGLDLTALKLLRELVARYPETPTLARARFLAPGMLLERADGEGDRLGYTRSSLRHTAAGELARFLVLHPDAPDAASAAIRLADALGALDDPSRSSRVLPGLTRQYRDHLDGWRLVVASARVALDLGEAGRALAILEDAPEATAGAASLAFERGRAFEALGRMDSAREEYGRSGLAEAAGRLAWLDRSGVVIPPMLVDDLVIPAALRPGTRARVSAIRLELESLLLRDGGVPGPNSVRVEGLRPEAVRDLRVGPTGDLPLPALPSGAWLLAIELDGFVHRAVALTGALEVRLAPGSAGSLVEVLDRAGQPVRGASVWCFDAAGTAHALRVDLAGRVWAPGGIERVLARAGSAYGWVDATETQPAAAMPAPYSNLPAYDDNAEAYGELFQQEKAMRVQASAL